MHSSSSPSTSEAISTTLACSVYTVQPLDHCHTHSLLCLCSKVIHILIIRHTSTSRVPESYQRYHMSPDDTRHSFCCHIQPNTHFSTHHLLWWITTTAVHHHLSCTSRSGTLHASKDLLPIASVPVLSALYSHPFFTTAAHLSCLF
jgi:hypothetical protein